MALNPVHALTAPELVALRQRIPPARTKLRLAIWPKVPEAVVWEARVTLPLPASNDMVYEIEFDGGGAGFGNTIRDQTVWIGSAPRTYDRGIVRLRAAAPGVAGTLEIGETSEVVWTDDDYITVLDEFGLWPRHVYLNPAGVIFMDRDIAYTDQHLYPDPVPVLLSDEIVEYDGVLGGANTVDVFQDASDSWALDGGAITYLWVAPGASATAGLATATPTMTYDAAGTFRVECTVSRNYGGGNISTFTGYRYVHIFDDNNPPVYSFVLDSCSGDWSSGGWSFTVTMEDNARLSEIVDRAKVILFANDNITSPGPIESDTHGVLRANILAIGWIAGETIHYNNEKGNVEFEVQGPAHWFNLMPAFPHTLDDFDGNPTTWLQFDDLAVRSGDWSWFHWRTTASRCMDYYVPIADARQIKRWTAPGSSSLWDQVSRVNESAILAHPCCDRYGRLWIQRPLSLLFNAERAGTPTVMEILRQDWREQLDLKRRVVDEVSILDASGVGYLDDNADPYYMLVLGHIYKRYGGIESEEKFALFQNQAVNNVFAGLLFDYMNNEYPAVDIRTSGNYRVVDIVPHQRLTMSIAEADTERGIEWTDKVLVPMTVLFTHDGGESVLDVDLSCELETFGVVGITGDPPVELPPVPVTPPPPPPPPIEPPPPPTNLGVALSNQDQMVISFNFFDQLSPDWYDLDPNSDLVGNVYNLVVGSNLEAYCTTRDLAGPDVNLTGTGVWYTPDVSDAVDGSLNWTLIIPVDGAAPSACADTGYNNTTHKPCFGSLFINEDNQACAAVHSTGGFPPPVGQSGLYICLAGVPAYQNLPLAGGQPLYVATPFFALMYTIWGWAGNFYIACSDQAVGWRANIYEVGVGIVVDFDPPDIVPPKCVNNGYFVSWNIILVPPNSNLFGGGAWNPAISEVLTIQHDRWGVVTDWMGLNTTDYLYSEDNGLLDLYFSGVGLIGDASVEFNGVEHGGMPAFYPLDTDQIVWTAGSGINFATQNVCVYTDDQGATWIVKDGIGATSIQGALGGVPNWSGWVNGTTCNVQTRIFAH